MAKTDKTDTLKKGVRKKGEMISIYYTGVFNNETYRDKFLNIINK